MRVGQSWPAGGGRRRWVSVRVPWWLLLFLALMALGLVGELVQGIARQFSG